ncbi:hypothetical protein pb186bvf_006361 [Paramecium bursaria]
MRSNQSSGQKPFKPLIEDEHPQNDMKSVLQRQIKILQPQEYYFLQYLVTTNQLYEEIIEIQNQLNKDQYFSIRRLFEYFDINGDKKIQFDDFFMTLQRLDILLRRDDLAKLFKRLGGEDDNIISYAEFASIFKFQNQPIWQLSKIGQEFILNESQQQLVNQLFLTYAKIEKSVIVLQNQIGDPEVLFAIFKKLDRTQKGYLVYDDIFSYLTNMGMKLKKGDYKIVFQRMQKYKSGRLSFEEFILEFSNEEGLKDYQNVEESKSQKASEPKSIINQQLQLQEQSFEQPKQSILNDFITKPKQRDLRQSDDSIQLPGFTRYQLQ